jgi:RNA polymerase sigma factor (sigma-70 family)
MARAPSGILLRHLRQLAGVDGLAGESDAQLVERFATHHDEAAFTILVKRHGPMVLGVCRRVLRDWQAADDVFQATFLVLARKASSIRKRESVGSWLHGVAQRLAVRAKETAARRQEREKRAAARSVASAAADAMWREVGAVLDEELNRLPERYRGPLLLCYLEGRTRDEAAQQLGLSLRTLKRCLERGRELLHIRLSRRGVTLSAGLCATALSQDIAAAAVPALLVDAVVKGARGGPLPGAATALAEGFLKSLGLARWKVAAVLFLTVSLLAGLGWAVHRSFASKGQTDGPGDEPKRAGSVRQRGRDADWHPRGQLHPDTEPSRPLAKEGAQRYRHEGPVACVAFAPNGTRVASGSVLGDTTLRLWEARSGRELYRMDLKSDVLTLAFSRDSKLLAAGCADRTVRLLEADTGKERYRLRGHQETVKGKEAYIQPGKHRGVSSLVFAADARTLISGGYDGTIRLWDVGSGKEVGQFVVPGNKIHCLALSSDRKTLAAGCQTLGGVGHHPIRLWDLTTRKAIRPDLPRFKDMYSNGPVRALAFAPDGKHLAAGGFDNEVLVWDVSTGRCIRSYRGGILWTIQSLAFSPDGKTLAAGCSNRRIYSWHATSAKPLRMYEGHSGPDHVPVFGVSSIAFSPDGTILVSGGCDKRVRLWEVFSGKERSFSGSVSPAR